MRNLLLFQVLLCAIFFASSGQAKIVIVEPKDGEWLPYLDEDKILRISGKVANSSAAEVTMNIDQQRSEKNEVWRFKVGKDGVFAFEISQFLIYPDIKTKITISALDSKGKSLETSSQFIYCCAAKGGKGYYRDLEIGKSQKIEITGSGSILANVGVKIPKEAIKSKISLVITEGNAERIKLKEYYPISPAIRFFFSNFKTPAGVIYYLKAYPSSPRDDMAREISKEDWKDITDKDWKDIDLKKSTLVILGSDDTGVHWNEIKYDRIEGDVVSFSLPEKDQVITTFVIAVKLDRK